MAGWTRQGGEPKSSAPEFFAPWPLLCVALFALNNAVLKHGWPGWLTGKLSDFLACFFLPLFLSAVLALSLRVGAATRVLIGLMVTGVVFSLVKTSALASGWLDAAVCALGRPIGIGPEPNRVDPTDLIALPMILLAWLYARTRLRPAVMEKP